MEKSRRDLTKRIQSRRSLSLRQLGEQPPSQKKGLDLSTPLNTIKETELDVSQKVEEPGPV